MNSRRWAVLACLIALALAVAPVTEASAGPPTGVDLKAAKRLLPEPQRGNKALRTMSAEDVAAAAHLNGRSVENLRGLLSHDDTAWLSAKGRLFYVDRADADQMATAQQDVPQSGALMTFPAANTLSLHSKPGSAHTAFLDFDGYSLPANAAWTDPNTGPTIPPGSYGGFSLDGSAAFSSAELAYIQTVWRIVSEKYAAFDVDVTTQAPSSDALNRTSAGDTTWGTRVVITNDMAARGGVCSANSGGGCVGIAWIDVFDGEQDYGYGTDGLEPAWVYSRFTNSDPVFSAGSVANTAAHELGHTLGLDHDTTAADPTGYYAGHDDWFAIMGSSNRAVGHFTNGSSYIGAFTYQVDPDTGLPNPDDIAVMVKAGAPLRTDDFPTTKALGDLSSYSVEGIIGRNGTSTTHDTDTFSVNRTCTNTLTATATGIGLGQAVDLKVTVRNALNQVVATADPATSGNTSTTPNTPVNMDATATVSNAGTGTWTITVDGVGLAGSTGYTDYGSLGRYRLDVTGCSNSPSEIFRFWSPRFNNAHFYTASRTESDQLRAVDANWSYEGVAFKAYLASSGTCTTAGTTPIYRFYSSKFTSHFYTASSTEANQVKSDSNWNYEGVAFCAFPSQTAGTTPVYRFWSPVYRKHFYTADQAEANHIRTTDPNWNDEGISYYALP